MSSTWLSTSVTVITLIVMLLGLFGLIMPVFPGLVIIWLAALGFGLISGFGTVGWVVFGLMTVLMLIGNISDGILMGKKAMEYGAAKSSMVLALFAGLFFSLILSPIGGLIVAPLVLYLAEKHQGRSKEEALKTTKGLMIGWGWSFLLRFAIGLVMIGLWVIWA